MGKQVSARIKRKIKSLFTRSINKMEKTIGKEHYSDRRMRNHKKH